MSDYALRLTRINYSYPDGTKALEGIDLDVRVGERMALVGPSGAGKSTLLLQLNGVLAGTGTVRIMGLALTGDNLKQVRRQVGLVFQDPNDQLFCPTVYEDVAFGPLNLSVPAQEIQHRVDKALRDVSLEQSVRYRSSHHLSLGERKRVALATVLAMEPAILALDEPTSNLDPRNRRHLIELVRTLPATLILATHDLEMVLELCSRTVLMDRGKIWADGQTSDVVGDNRLMAEHGLEVPLSLKSKVQGPRSEVENRK
jgi:cobalt/nickel transport system ATP-binding protein